LPNDELMGAFVDNNETYLFYPEETWEYEDGVIDKIGNRSQDSCEGQVVEHKYLVYYTSREYLGRVDWHLDDPGDYDDTWATFISGHAPHPMARLNDNLYIGDNNYVAMVDESDVFTGDKLQLGGGVRALVSTSGMLLIGMTDGVYEWDGHSDLPTTFTSIPETPIHSMVSFGGTVLIQAGLKGSIYQYGRDNITLFKRILADGIVSLSAGYTKDNKLYVGLGGGYGVVEDNLASKGVYELGRSDNGYPLVFNMKYPLPSGDASDARIACVSEAENESNNMSLLVGYEFDGTDYVAVENRDVKCNQAYLETKVIKIAREDQSTFKIKIAYKELPTYTDIDIQVSVNYGEYSANLEKVIDTDRKIVEVVHVIPNANTVQFKIIPTVSGNDAPIIESIIIDYDE